MKILQILHQFLPSHMAGSEIYTWHLARELQKHHDVRVICTERDPSLPLHSLRNRDYQGLPVTEIINNHESLSFESVYLNPGIDSVFEEILDREKPDIVHFQHLVLLSMNLPAIAKHRGIPAVITLHEYWYQCPASGQRMLEDLSICREIDFNKCASCVKTSPYVFRGKQTFSEPSETRAPGVRGFLEKKMSFLFKEKNDSALNAVKKRDQIMRSSLEQADLLIAPSQFLRQEFLRWGVPENKILYSDYGFDKTPFRSFEKIPSDKIRFAFVGSLMQHKGADLLIEAFRGVPADKAALDIYGNPHVRPAYVADLKKSAEGLPIRFHGEWNTHRIQDAYREIDVLVVPSRWFENSPLTIHEALMAGAPVITANLGGMAELVKDGETGLLFKAGSAESLRGKMLEIMKRPDLLKADPARGITVKSIEDDARFHEELYHRLIQESSPCKNIRPL